MQILRSLINELAGRPMFTRAAGGALILLAGLWFFVRAIDSYHAELKEQYAAVAELTPYVVMVVSDLPYADRAAANKRLEVLVRATSLEHVRIIVDGQTFVSSTGEENYPLKPHGASGHAVRAHVLYVWREIALPPSCPSGRGLLVFVASKAGSGVHHGTPRGHLFLTILVLACGCAALLALVFSVVARNQRLREELQAVTTRRGQAEELSLAAAGLAHETKNPLGIIRGLAQQIANDATNSDDARGKAEDIMEEADITTARLGDFISYAKLRTPELAPVDAAAHVGSVCNLVREDFESNHVSLDVAVAPLRIMADAEMLSQVLLNILINSQKSTVSGESVSLALTSVGRRHAMLRVTDTGCGIPAEFLPNIFKPYSSKRSGGYGIGMAIVKKIVEQSGWDITVTSEEGTGTDVVITGIDVVQ